MVGLLKPTARPGSVEALSEIGELNPSVTAVVTVLKVLALRLTVTLAGEADTPKSAAGVEAFTVSATVALCTVEPLVPVIVMLYVPAAVPASTANVATELPAPVIEAGLKLTVTPFGAPVADNPMA